MKAVQWEPSVSWRMDTETDRRTDRKEEAKRRCSKILDSSKKFNNYIK